MWPCRDGHSHPTMGSAICCKGHDYGPGVQNSDLIERIEELERAVAVLATKIMGLEENNGP